MATTNINKIARGKLNFKPWIGSKNTNAIVNSYVQKFYKQIPNEFKNDLKKTRASGTQKTEQQLPFRKVVPEKFSIPIISNSQASKLRSNGYRSPVMTAKNSFVASPTKKLLKTPNYKIYTRRRYASSATSSKSNIVRHKPDKGEEYRKKIYAPANGMQFTTFRGSAPLPHLKFSYNSIVSKFIPPKRLVNDSTQRSKTVEVSNAICNDLMTINEVLKKKICMVKPKNEKPAEPLETPKQTFLDLSFKAWNHPSVGHYAKLTTAPVIKKPAMNGSNRSLLQSDSSFRLMPVKRKVHMMSHKVPTSISLPKKKNKKYQFGSSSSNNRRFTSNSSGVSKKLLRTTSTQNAPLGFGSFDRHDSRFKSPKIDNKSEEPDQPDQPDQQPEQEISDVKQPNETAEDPLDFVCLTRAERRERNRNQRRQELKEKPTVEPLEIQKDEQKLLNLSFKGCNDLLIRHYSKLKTLPVIKKYDKTITGTASSDGLSFRLMPVSKRKTTDTKTNTKDSTSSSDPKKINAKLQMSDSTYYNALNLNSGRESKRRNNSPNSMRFDPYDRHDSWYQSLKMDDYQPEKEKPIVTSKLQKDPFEFVDLSRRYENKQQRTRNPERQKNPFVGPLDISNENYLIDSPTPSSELISFRLMKVKPKVMSDKKFSSDSKNTKKSSSSDSKRTNAKLLINFNSSLYDDFNLNFGAESKKRTNTPRPISGSYDRYDSRFLKIDENPGTAEIKERYRNIERKKNIAVGPWDLSTSKNKKYLSTEHYNALKASEAMRNYEKYSKEEDSQLSSFLMNPLKKKTNIIPIPPTCSLPKHINPKLLQPSCSSSIQKRLSSHFGEQPKELDTPEHLNHSVSRFQYAKMVDQQDKPKSNEKPSKNGDLLDSYYLLDSIYSRAKRKYRDRLEDGSEDEIQF